MCSGRPRFKPPPEACHALPHRSGIEALRKAHKEWKGWEWAVVNVDPAALDNTLERVNISLAPPCAASPGRPGRCNG